MVRTSIGTQHPEPGRPRSGGTRRGITVVAVLAVLTLGLASCGDPDGGGGGGGYVAAGQVQQPAVR